PIEQYPGMKDTSYNSPDTMPDAVRTMNAIQSKHDRSLKRLQYRASAQQLVDLNRLIGCIYPHSGISALTMIPSFSLGPYNLSVQDNTFWSFLSALIFHQDNQTCSQMASAPEHSTQFLPRRVGSDRGFVSTSTSTSTASCTESSVTWMDNQYEEIDSDSNATTRSPRLFIEYHHHDSSVTRTESSTDDSQLDHDNSVCNLRFTTSSI
ncbi:hypothetical protein CU097_001503, partial [Rhizopus azygosporus]